MKANRRAFVSDPDFVLYVGDACEVLADLPDESVDCCVTSPPYWGLRDYGTGTWAGGDPDCDHVQSRATQNMDKLGERYRGGGKKASSEGAIVAQFRDLCGKCGASRTDRQLGLEPTPAEYVAAMVAVFAQVRRVLRPEGTLWLNLGDTYAHGGNGARDLEKWPKQSRNNHSPEYRNTAGGKPKDLCGIPWRTAIALMEDGWYLRSDIIWSKPNPMPESVTDRPTKAHEYVFLLAKSERYFFDQDAVREPSITGDTRRPYGSDGAWQMDGRPAEQRHGGEQRKTPTWEERKAAGATRGGTGFDVAAGRKGSGNQRGVHGEGVSHHLGDPALGRNVRTVWEIATHSYPDAHFATFPEELPRRCIAAGCPAGGTVLDPFMGSGTTALVARNLGRKTVGVELNPKYAKLCASRLGQQSLFAEPAVIVQPRPSRHPGPL